jgi:hypothetical protein
MLQISCLKNHLLEDLNIKKETNNNGTLIGAIPEQDVIWFGVKRGTAV